MTCVTTCDDCGEWRRCRQVVCEDLDHDDPAQGAWLCDGCVAELVAEQQTDELWTPGMEEL